jgi:hypothetical protein
MGLWMRFTSSLVAAGAMVAALFTAWRLLLALAGRDTDNRTVSLILDTTTANIAMYAIAAYAGDREAHVCEVELFGQRLPEDSYGRQNVRSSLPARPGSPPGYGP